ncbi:uncharacterized protein LOC131622176 [Vicia villosa]|uniref:uncharacterized protein LOC131622176 n=1 Tax=Vicia villosa TaxID=3911 RepID=UPI00273B2FC9|nr:uncharacterized protein LOC131622176 [Vicia villosa]
MVPEEVLATRAESDWSCVDGYITWYYRVLHPYMFPVALGDPSRPAHEEILRTHQAEMDHTQDILLRYRQIAGTDLRAIVDGLFPEGSEQRRVVDVMIRLEEEAFMYRRHRARAGGTFDARGRASKGRGGRRGGGGAKGRGEAHDDVRHTH